MSVPETAMNKNHRRVLGEYNVGSPGKITPQEMAVLWSLAQGEGERTPDAPARGYFIPLSATYSLRMQSNFHRKWLMHGEEP